MPFTWHCSIAVGDLTDITLRHMLVSACEVWKNVYGLWAAALSFSQIPSKERVLTPGFP